MTTAIIVLSVLLALAIFWIAALYVEKKGLLKDEDGDYIPDVIEDKVQDVKDGVNQKVDSVKEKVKNVKKALK